MSNCADSIALESIDLEGVDGLKELWLELHAHHRAIAPELAPYADDQQSWSARCGLYRRVLERDGFAVRATAGSADVGYLFAARAPQPWPTLFSGPSEIWELLTLVVRPGWRARGVGSLLFEAFERQVRSSSLDHAMIGLLPGNTGALRFYERRGFAPTWLTLTRFMRGAERGGGIPRVIVPVSVEDVDTLRPVWLAERARHLHAAPGLAPCSSAERSWEVMRPVLCRAAGDEFLWRAHDSGGRTRGFLSGHVGDDSLWVDAWQTAPRVGEIDTIAIVDHQREGDIREGLLDAADQSLRKAGILDRAAGVPAADVSAIGAFERRGYQPAWLQVTRFPGRASGG